MERRLAAVMIADVCGYGLLTQADEEGTCARFQTDLHDLFEQRIAAHRGRLIKTMGDGLLVEFHSVVEAVRCAVEVQRVKSKSRGVDAGRLEFRIGINLGDVIVEGDDIQGDGVIIAERLQSLAEPGGIVISGTAYDQVEKHLDVGFVFLGEQHLKHIEKPVRTYRLWLDEAHAAKAKVRTRHARRWAAFATAAVVFAAAAGVAWWRPWEPAAESRLEQALDLSVADKPSIAVLPFANVSDDPKQDFFADGMTDGLVTELAQVSGLFVIARNSTFTYKGKSVTPRQVSEELGVRYVLEGSVQRAGEQLRINAQLIDSLSGGNVWAGKFDGSLSDVFALQDEVMRGIAEALALRLDPDQQMAFGRKETAVPAAFDAFLRGWEHHRRTTPEDFAKAVPYFEQAIALDPAYGRAYAAAAMVYARIYLWRWHYQLGIPRFEARAKARQYLRTAQKHRTALAYQAAALLSGADWQHADALAELRQAIALEPGDSWSYALTAFVLTSAGRPAEALPYIRTAIRLDPHSPSFFLYVLGLTQFSLEDFEAAAAAARRSIELNSKDDGPFLLLASAAGHLGHRAEAEAAVNRYNALRISRGGTAVCISAHPPLDLAQPLASERFYQGLRLAGVPETLMNADFAASNRLSADDVRSLFFGHQLRGRMLDTGEEHEAVISTEGIASLTGDWASMGAGRMSGVEVRFEKDEVCFLWLKTTNLCGMVLRNPGGTRARENEYIWYHGDRAFTFSQVR
ncbi:MULTISPECIES: adenylate/guanylate cyclase domain-containing protein [unclassified Ensifer]|uniref:adenylate/guanylate cyclase domain-containing protein n=1 Tax=unclassified Ensifer TaxID=2633371 RepID=UPI0008136719|nr:MULTISPECIES: adenylate/guanylate cyclase domain-containing protein [unclassified Ensifer]OCO99011.1 guanylyl cyclase [Ensifer sp. LC14]OCP11368.1 guanylyl cyclase [Ensifer sp. LC13]OCP11989.1 guanylyl cyclase [Ensifer sp. LC11]OCP33498.1 guanylyl cyclase [Ensifer sp. LC499]